VIERQLQVWFAGNFTFVDKFLSEARDSLLDPDPAKDSEIQLTRYAQ